MLEQLIERILPTIIAALELMGIFIVAVSALSASRYLKACSPHPLRRQVRPGQRSGPQPGVQNGRRDSQDRLVRDLKELLVLGAVILLRALLSFLIHFEMKGTHPPK